MAEETSRYILAESPDLTWIYHNHPDAVGHKYADSDFFYEAVKYIDCQRGDNWAAIKTVKKEKGENWQIFIITDHGRDVITGKGHGGQSERESLTWIVTNTPNLNTYFKAETPGIVDIAPTILKVMNLNPQKDNLWGLDGVPPTGPI